MSTINRITRKVYRAVLPASVRDSTVVARWKKGLLGKSWFYDSDFFDSAIMLFDIAQKHSNVNSFCGLKALIPNFYAFDFCIFVDCPITFFFTVSGSSLK